MLAAWPLLVAVVARLPSCSWESGGAVTVAINITGFASPCATDSHSAEKLRSHIPQRGLLGKQRPSALLRVCYMSISSGLLRTKATCLRCPRSISRLQEREVPIPDRRTMACPTAGQASVLAGGYWSAVFVLLVAALSALYARRGHSRASPEPLPALVATVWTDSALSEETKPSHRAAARRRARRPAARAPVAADTSDGSSEADFDDECLERLLQLHSPARVAADATRMRSPTVAAQPTQSAASAKREPPEEAWDAVATPRKRAARAPAACRTEPRASPDASGTADASDDQLEDWGELYSAHSKVRCAPGSYPPNPNHSDTHAAFCSLRRMLHTGARASTVATCAPPCSASTPLTVAKPSEAPASMNDFRNAQRSLKCS